jgi:glucosylceramidase
MAATGNRLTLYASPWSPPAFMKDNNDLLHGGRLRPEYYDSWARYYTRFIKSYRAKGYRCGDHHPEQPMATQIWESCIYQAEDERDFLKNHLRSGHEQEGSATSTSSSGITT